MNATLNSEVLNNELEQIEVIQRSLVEKVEHLKSIVKNASLDSQEVVTWGPGRAIPVYIKNKIATEIKEGKSGRQIAKTNRVSLPSVYKIRQSMGITKRGSMFG